MLLRDDTVVYTEQGDSTDVVLVAPLFRVVHPIGRPPAAVVAEAIEDRHAPWSLVAEAGEAAYLSAICPGWRFERARVARRRHGAALPRLVPEGVTLRLLEPADRDAIAGIPDDEVRDELERVFGHVVSAAAFVGGRPVSFCSGYPETETRYDLAIDTLEGYRRRGLARATAAFLIRHMATRGKQPVWGALESNTASIRLAESIGFEWVGELAVGEAPGQAPRSTIA